MGSNAVPMRGRQEKGPQRRVSGVLPHQAAASMIVDRRDRAREWRMHRLVAAAGAVRGAEWSEDVLGGFHLQGARAVCMCWSILTRFAWLGLAVEEPVSPTFKGRKLHNWGKTFEFQPAVIVEVSLEPALSDFRHGLVVSNIGFQNAEGVSGVQRLTCLQTDAFGAQPNSAFRFRDLLELGSPALFHGPLFPI